MKRRILIALALAAALLPSLARAQTQGGGLAFIPLGTCQIGTVTSSTAQGLSACVAATFTGTGSGVNLTASSVTGAIGVGQTITGTGVPSNTTIVSQTSGSGGCAPVSQVSGASCAAGGAGVYVTSNPTTSSSASLSSGGVPLGAKYVTIRVTQSINWRDDGAPPTSSIGIPINSTDVQGLWYTGRLNAIQFIAASTSGAVNASFYAGQP